MNTNTRRTRPSRSPTLRPAIDPGVVGIRSTGVYCRPRCGALGRALLENHVRFATAAGAEAEGYRPCRVCRPERTSEVVRHAVGETAFGWIFVASGSTGVGVLCLLEDPDPAPGLERVARECPGAVAEADAPDGEVSALIPRIEAFVLSGTPCDVPLDLHGTAFQMAVWEALRKIPHGQTTTYGALAEALGLSRGLARAVGGACGANPVSLLVPCHRVVGAGGGLGGYYWGLDRKRLLLDLERAGARADCQKSARESLTAVP